MIFVVVTYKDIHRLIGVDNVDYLAIGVFPIVKNKKTHICLNDEAVMPDVCHFVVHVGERFLEVYTESDLDTICKDISKS